MVKLSVNLNKVATIRNTRQVGYPRVTQAANLCLSAGAHGITVHPRPDQRHITTKDVHELLPITKNAEFNIEGNPFHNLMDLAAAIKPTQCTLVPDDPAQSTSDHGWDLGRDGDKLAPLIRQLKDLGCRVSLFMDADPEKIYAAKEVGADRVELYTEPYAENFATDKEQITWELFANTAVAAQKVGLGVNAGHDLNLDNLKKFCTIPNLLEVSIGHAFVGDCLWNGIVKTTQLYLTEIKKGEAATR